MVQRLVGLPCDRALLLLLFLGIGAVLTYHNYISTAVVMNYVLDHGLGATEGSCRLLQRSRSSGHNDLQLSVLVGRVSPLRKGVRTPVGIITENLLVGQVN